MGKLTVTYSHFQEQILLFQHWYVVKASDSKQNVFDNIYVYMY